MPRNNNINLRIEIENYSLLISKPLRQGNTIQLLLKEGDHSTSHMLVNTTVLGLPQWRVCSLYIGFIHTIPWVITMALLIPYIQYYRLLTLFPDYLWSLTLSELTLYLLTMAYLFITLTSHYYLGYPLVYPILPPQVYYFSRKVR